jgi:uncharacterized protein (TIGR03083 family)
VTIDATQVKDVPVLDHREAATISVAENARFVALVQSLAPEEWTRPTDCSAWDVRDLVSHVVGAMEGHVSLRVFTHQVVAGTRAAGDRPQVDGMTEVQVRERSGLAPGQLLERLVVVGPQAAQARARRPALLRALRFPQEVGPSKEWWSLGYLFDKVLTRDTWMHRVDIARATGRPIELTADHDGRIVADVVAEWARRHGRPFALTLTGPAGGSFTAGVQGEAITMDAVEFCRALSGRGPMGAPFGQAVPF